MTPEQRRLYHYRWDRFQKRYERIFTKKFMAALQQQVQQQLSQGFITSTPIYKVLVELYTTVGPLWANQARLLIKKQEVKARMPMGFLDRIVELMRQYYGIDLLNDAELITDFTREVIRNILSEAAQSGDSINDITRSLTSSTELGQMRARRIARTETVTAANGAAVIHAKESGVPMNKIWLSVHDKRTRHAHVLADNNTVALDNPFSVGGELMMQPGVREQTNGLPVSAGNVVNCRCTVAFEVIE
jgi:uncharacterized protein with gpF-like domain